MAESVSTDTLAFMVSDIARMMQAVMERRIADARLGITPGEARTLIYAAALGSVPQAKLAERMKVDPMTVSGYLGKLEAAGLIERVANPADRRVKQIVVTGKADAVIGFLEDETARVQEHACRGLNCGDGETLARLLKSLRLNLCELVGSEACSSARSA
jgi:DNA-binding MarR family transcriptional regulator